MPVSRIDPRDESFEFIYECYKAPQNIVMNISDTTEVEKGAEAYIHKGGGGDAEGGGEDGPRDIIMPQGDQISIKICAIALLWMRIVRPPKVTVQVRLQSFSRDTEGVGRYTGRLPAVRRWRI